MLKEVMTSPPQQTGDNVMSVTTSGVDPFLGQATSTGDAHARQNSADSGLGTSLHMIMTSYRTFMPSQIKCLMISLLSALSLNQGCQIKIKFIEIHHFHLVVLNLDVLPKLNFLRKISLMNEHIIYCNYTLRNIVPKIENMIN